MTSHEFKVICKMFEELERKLDTKLNGFSKQFMDMMKGFSIIDPDKQTMTTKEVCRQYGVSERKLCDMRKNGEIPFTQIGTGRNSKAIYRCVDVAEVFAERTD